MSILLYPFIGATYRKYFGGRGDGNPELKYYQPNEFGVQTSPFSFLSGKWRLHGERYFTSQGPYPAVVIFFHGLSAGRSSYNKEICALAKAGFLVFAYDNTGCMESEGKGMGNMAQTYLDQKAFFSYLDTQQDVANLPRYTIGHSWGGFGALLALQKEYRVEKAISVSGFFSLDGVSVSVSDQLKRIQKTIHGYIASFYGKGAAVNVLDLVKERPEVPVLYIQGENDGVVRTDLHLKYLENHAAEYPNVKTMCLKGRAHQAFWTIAAQDYYNSLFFRKDGTKPTDEELAAIDYEKLTEDDPVVMQAIIDFFSR